MMTHHGQSYRHDITERVWRRVRDRESCVVVGVSGVGKTRLLDFMLREDVKRQALGDQSATLVLALVDCNRASELTEWGLYELMLTGIVEAIDDVAVNDATHRRLIALRRESTLNRSALLAQRNLEAAMHMLCGEAGFRFALLLDEFDAFYAQLPETAFANLRALRDLVKRFEYGLSYVLMMRDTPERLRDPGDVEGFYELVSRNVFGLTLCSRDDAVAVLGHSLLRRGLTLANEDMDRLLELSGGHPGLIDALVVDSCTDSAVLWQDGLSRGATEECRKIWVGLAEDERLTLSRLAAKRVVDNSDSAYLLLSLKGLITSGQIFCVVFTRYVLNLGLSSKRLFSIDEKAHVVWIGNDPITTLRDREFKLLKLLHDRAGTVVERDAVLAAVYPEDRLTRSENEENRLDAMIKRLRAKIEPIPSSPSYLQTVPSVGFRLVVNP